MIDNKSPFVSVIIPVYNMERFVQECLDSVRRQTLRNIEIICVNDGSSDSSLEILRKNESEDPRIIVIDKPNGGVSSARNAAYSRVRGKYVYFVDADDTIDSNLCEKLFNTVESFDADVAYLFVKIEPNAGFYLPSLRFLQSDHLQINDRKYLIRAFSGGPYTKFFRFAFLLKNQLSFPPYRIGEDQVLHWQTAILADRVAICPEALYHYRNNPSSAVNQGGENRFDIFDVFQTIRNFLECRSTLLPISPSPNTSTPSSVKNTQTTHSLLENEEDKTSSQLFDDYIDLFYYLELEHIYIQTHSIKRELRAEAMERICRYLRAEEWEFIKQNKLPPFIQHYYLSLHQNIWTRLRSRLRVFFTWIVKSAKLHQIKSSLKRFLLQRLDSSTSTRNQVFSHTISDLRQEIVRLHGKDEYEDTKGK